MAQTLLQTVWLIPCYALIGGILAIPWSPGIIRRTGPRPAGYVNLLMSIMAFLHGLLALPATWHQPPQEIVFPWLNVAGLDISIPLQISSITVGATLLITGLNLLAQIYAIGYLEMDWGWARFYSLLALFEAGMCSLVLCNSLFISYMILEILTLGTYLLVGLWFSQPLVVTGARDAFLTKRIGDLLLLMAVLALLPIAGTWNFTDLAAWAEDATLGPTTPFLLGLALLAGPMGKCAQFPLHLWLDEAMEGPMPASILRNTVVVETGAWILLKLQPVFALSPSVMELAVWIGAATAVGTTAIATAQIDAKRALSYSVSAFMGIIFMSIGTNQPPELILNLMFTYACAMGLLVMASGSIIFNNVTQDLTQLGGLWSRRPIAGLAFLIGGLSLIAMPPFGGFWSLLEIVNNLWQTRPELAGVLIFVNGLTAFSITREFGLIFAGKPKPMTERSPEAFWPISLPIIFLMGFNLHIPLLLMKWQLLPSWASINLFVAILLVGSSLVGLGSGVFIYLNDRWAKPVRLPWPQVQDFFAYDFYTPKLYRVTVVFLVGVVSRLVYLFDRYLVDGVINLVGLATIFSGQSLKYNVSGQTQFYALTILAGVVLIGLWISWPILSHLSLILGG